MFDLDWLPRLWTATAIHLWQTTLILLPLIVLGRLIRNGPARFGNLLWSIGLVKLLLPLPLIAPFSRWIVCLLEKMFPALQTGDYGSTWMGKAALVLDPTVFVVKGASGSAVESGYLSVILTAAWLGGAALLTHRWIRRRPRYEYRDMAPADLASSELGRRLRAALERTSIPGQVIRIDTGSALPAVVGLFRRRIVISERMIRELTAEELRAILLHEEEHRRRFDPLRGVVQRIALLAFFYYPPLWAILRQLSSSSEMACDEAALRAGTPPPTFARALARSLKLGLRPAPSPAGLGLETRSTIQNRFHRLRNHGRYVTMSRHRLVIAMAISLVALASLVPLPPFAAGGNDEGDTPVPPRPPVEAEVKGEPPHPPPAPAGPQDGLVRMPVLIVKSRVLPEYPEAERKAGIEGEVVLEVEVLEDGTVGQVAVTQGVEGHPSLAESATKAISQWKFEPGTEDGKPVKTTITVPFTFALDDHEKPEDVDTMPEIIKEAVVNPEYPEDGRKNGVSGKVMLEVVIEADGTPESIIVKEGIAGYPSFGEEAIRAVRQWKFKPATKGGRPVATTVVIPVRFRLDDK